MIGYRLGVHIEQDFRNQVRGSVADDDFRVLLVELPGTLVYGERKGASSLGIGTKFVRSLEGIVSHRSLYSYHGSAICS
jgi:hypothetical protein